MSVGYDVQRIAELGRRTHAALEDLAGITSTDPESGEAMATLRRMQTALADGLLPALHAIEAADPLSGSIARSANPGLTWYAEWLASVRPNPYRPMSDDRLLLEFERLEGDVPFDEHFRPDTGHPFWNEFGDLADELAIRVAADRDFADRVVRQARDSFLIPIAVSFATFEPAVVGRMLRDVARTRSAMVDLVSNYQAHGADVLLEFLARHPGAALDAIDLPTLTELFAWSTIDRQGVGRFLDAAMSVPFLDPARLDDAHVVLQHLVTLANRRAYESGFPPELSPAIARIVIEYLPFFVTSLRGFGVVHLKDFDFRDADAPLGTYLEVIDLFGALMRDSPSLDIVLASVPTIAIMGAGDHGPLGITPDDVANYIDTLGKAARNEQIEVQRAVERHEADALWAIDIAFDLASLVLGPATVGGLEAPLEVVKHWTHSAVEWMAAETDLGLGDVESVAYLLVVFGLGVGVLRSRTSRSGASHDSSEPHHSGHHAEADRDADPDAVTDSPTDAERDTIRSAEGMLAELESRLSDGATIDEIGGLVDDFGRTVRRLDREHIMDVIDDPRVLPVDDDIDRENDSDG